MLKSNQCLNRLYLLMALLLWSNWGWTQNCTPLTRDSITDPGPYTVATLIEADGLRDGPDYSGATIYYPTNATPPFASIILVPGYLTAPSSIQDWGPFLASYGIVTMTIGTNSIFDSPYDRRDGLLDALLTMAQENIRTNSPLNGNLDLTRRAVGGWSMGGGGAQLAAASDTTLKAVLALCPFLNRGQLTPADLNHPVPTVILSAELDAIAPTASNAEVHYRYIPSTTKKLIFEINNGGHRAANSPTGGQGFAGKIALSWLKQYLMEDDCYCPLLIDTPSTASNYSTNVICPATNISTRNLARATVSTSHIYPNPCSNSINLEVEQVGPGTKYEVVTLSGMQVKCGVIANQVTTIDLGTLPAGVYIMNVIQLRSSEKIKFVVL